MTGLRSVDVSLQFRHGGIASFFPHNTPSLKCPWVLRLLALEQSTRAKIEIDASCKSNPDEANSQPHVKELQEFELLLQEKLYAYARPRDAIVTIPVP